MSITGSTEKQNIAMKQNIRLLPALALALCFTFTACKKETKDPDTSTDTEVTKHSEDQTNVSNSMDMITNDINAAVETSASFSGRGMNTQNICNTSITLDTLSNPRRITITYNGADCSGTVTRQGVVTVSMPQNMRWRDAGAQLTVNYQNLRLTRIADNKSIVINGTHLLTNVNGGLLYQLPNLNNITHTIQSSNMSITFDDNSQRVWQVARQRVFTYNNGIVITTTGLHTAGNITGITEWGTNRFGHAFTTAISSPLVMRQDCLFRLGSGEVTHQGFATVTVKFGLDAQGNATGCPGANAYYGRITWTGPNGNSVTHLFPY